MDKNSTHELLIRHIYGETSPSEREQMAYELVTNDALHSELDAMLEAKQLLDGNLRQPSQTSLQIIMEHSLRTEHLQES